MMEHSYGPSSWELRQEVMSSLRLALATEGDLPSTDRRRVKTVCGCDV